MRGERFSALAGYRLVKITNLIPYHRYNTQRSTQVA